MSRASPAESDAAILGDIVSLELRTLLAASLLACGGGSADRAVVHLSAPKASTAPSATAGAAPPVATMPPPRTDDPCGEVVCRGQAGDDTVQGITTLAHVTRRKCYDPALADDPKLEGHAMVRMRISSAGTICEARVTQNDMKDASVADCAATVFRGASIPPPEGGCVEVNLPLRFVPIGKDAGP